MNDQNDRYRTLAQWDAYVAPLIEALYDVQWDRLTQQVANRAGKFFRLRGPGFSVYDRPKLKIIRWETPAEHSRRQMALFRRLTYKHYADQDAREEPQALNPQEYAAARLLRISQHLGRYEQPSGRIMEAPRWTLVEPLKQVLTAGDRTPATVGRVLGLVDWFRHCLGIPALKTPQVQITVLSPLEQILVGKFEIKDLNKLAKAVRLVNEDGRFCASDKGAFVGFCTELKHHGKLTGTIQHMAATVGKHFGVEVKTRKGGSDVAREFADRVKKALKDAN